LRGSKLRARTTGAGREARRRSHAGSGQASAVYTIDRAVILGRRGGFAQVACGEHCDILFESLVFINFAASLRVDHSHLSLYTTLLGEKLLVLAGFSLGLRYVSTRRGRNVSRTISKHKPDFPASRSNKKGSGRESKNDRRHHSIKTSGKRGACLGNITEQSYEFTFESRDKMLKQDTEDNRKDKAQNMIVGRKETTKQSRLTGVILLNACNKDNLLAYVL
jgi:hypothetical protein